MALVSTMTHTPNKTRTILTWIGISLLGLAFLGAGAGKLTGGMDEQLGDLGVPAWAIPAIGIIEIGAAIAMIVPRSRFYGAAILMGTMLGATVTHLANADWAGLPPSIVLTILTGIVTWTHRPEWVQERLTPGAAA